MTNQEYGQYCGLARALEVVGEPWALLVVRDLMVASKTFAELREGLPKMSDEDLTARLEELESAGVIRRHAPFEPKAVARWELTEYGSELDDVVLQLARWGARTLGSPRRDEIVTADSMVMALRTVFRPEAARRLRVNYVIEAGDIVVYARVNDGQVEVGKGGIPHEALECGGVRLRAGDVSLAADPGLLAWFVEVFHIAPAPPVHASRSGLMPGPAVGIKGRAVPVGA
jgi:DNA-binding HxlR family transcriptional regulator